MSRQQSDRARRTLSIWLFWLGNWAFSTGHRIEPPYVGPRCPDCQMPERECYCEAKQDQQRQYDDAYGAGWEDALQVDR